jgi:hypothetical protein
VHVKVSPSSRYLPQALNVHWIGFESVYLAGIADKLQQPGCEQPTARADIENNAPRPHQLVDKYLDYSSAAGGAVPPQHLGQCGSPIVKLANDWAKNTFQVHSTRSVP